MSAADAAPMTVDQAIAFLHEHAPGVRWAFDNVEQVQAAYRTAAKRLHPDAGGDEELFKRLDEAVRVIGGAR